MLTDDKGTIMANNRNFEVKNGLETTQTVTAGAFVGDGSQLTSLNFANISTSLPDPTLTLTGDATGSATFTNLGNATLTVNVTGGDADSIAGTPASGLTLDYVTNNGTSTSNTITTGGLNTGNIVTSGYIRGGSTLTIDPSPYNNDSGNVVIRGNLQVTGTTTTFDSTVVTIDDINLLIANGATNAAAANGAGITADLGADGVATITYVSGTDRWTFNKNIEASNFIGNASTANQWSTARTISLSGAVTGSTSIDGSSNVTISTTATADPTLTLTGDATGSATFTNLSNATLNVNVTGGDADTLDGINSTQFLRTSGGVTYTSNSAANPFNVTRSGGVGESLGISVGDTEATLRRQNDETTADVQFDLIATDTETGGGASANSGSIRFNQSPSGTTITINGDRVLTTADDVSDADTLDGQNGVYYLNFNNFSNVPDPTLTLTGDVSGSATFTNLTNATLSVTIADDSHNHTIANVDGLQSALNGKLGASATASNSQQLDGLDSTAFLRANAANDYIEFVNNEITSYSQDGRMWWDASEGAYVVSSNAPNNTGPALLWSSANFTAGTGLSVSYTASDRPTLSLTGDSFSSTATYSGLTAGDAQTLDGINSTGFFQLDQRNDGYLWVRRSSSGSALYVTQQSTGDIARFYQGSGDGTEVASVQNDGTIVSSAGFVGDGSQLTGITASNASTLDGIDSTQFLRSDTSDSASGVITFTNVVNHSGTVTLADRILHIGDEDTYMQFHNLKQWRVVTGGGERLEVTNSTTTIQTDLVIPSGTVGTNATRDVFISTSGPGPGDGQDGDIWYTYTP